MSSPKSNSKSSKSSNKEAPGLYSLSTIKTKQMKSGTFVIGENGRRIRDPITLEFIPAERAFILDAEGNVSSGVIYDVNVLYTWFIEKDKDKIPHAAKLNPHKLTELRDKIKTKYYSLPGNAEKILELQLKAFWEKYNAGYINTPFPKFLQEYKDILSISDQKQRRNYAHNILGYTLKELLIQHGFI